MTSPKPPLSPSDSVVPETGSSAATGCVGMVWHSAKEGAERFVERLLDCNFTNSEQYGRLDFKGSKKER